MVDGWLATMTSHERLLLHLLENPLPERAWDVKPHLTQAGISEAIFVHRKHVPRTLKLAMKRGFVADDTRHIIGSKQRRKVYLLTPEGKQQAGELVSRLKEMSIDKEGEQYVVSEIIGHEKMLHFLAHIDGHCKWHEDAVSIFSPPPGENIAAEEIFTSVLGQAWRDGHLSDDEMGIISVLSRVLDFPQSELERISSAASLARDAANAESPGESSVTAASSSNSTEESAGELSESDAIYLEVLIEAFSDGQLIREEDAMLSRLRSSLGLVEGAHEKLLITARAQLGLDTTETTHVMAYADALRVALADHIITDDEEAILESLRSSLNISSQQHLLLLAAERAKLN
jgi:hypothetical protein